MPFCPSCQTEYRAGFTRCADCDVELVPSLVQDAQEEGDAGPVELDELATFPNASEAEMIQELLEDNGISTVLRGDVDPLGIVAGSDTITLLVKQEDLQEARRLYDEYFAGEVEGESQSEASGDGEDSDQPPQTDPLKRT